ncbi:hypothetical protein SteCoe_13007 [Stentor coeruleus]|uniref:Protein kinase domain-containing protein n=1 Tax=Stentor coeruleus TaxID=5963 RepID=A0A1R2C9L1_9CILI|nr:hypothetical protein SteCoe_13007 [Stentor coeruleus]
MSSFKETHKIKTRKDRNNIKHINNYPLLEKLGEGANSKVFLSKRNKTFYAIKIINTDNLSRQKEFIKGPNGGTIIKTALDSIYREINILKTLNHENIIKIFEVIYDEDNGKIYIVMENCSKGSLMSWDTKENKFIIKWVEGSINEEILRHIFRQIVYGVHYLHMQLIVHYDLKPQNILLTEDLSVKISDFDRAFNLVTSDFLPKNPGTYQFFPPENISNISHNSSYRCKAVDMWCLGLILYSFIYNVLPFNGQNIAELFKSIEEFEYDINRLSFPDNPIISEGLRDLIRKLLDKNPNNRITIHGALIDPWLNCT